MLVCEHLYVNRKLNGNKIKKEIGRFESLCTSQISIFCNLRRNVFSNFNRNDLIDQNIVYLNVCNNETYYNKAHEENDKVKVYEKEIQNFYKYDKLRYVDEHNNICCNLIKDIFLYGVNLNVDIFILKNSNIIFFLQNVINIYNPLIKSLRVIYTKKDYMITCSSLFKDTLIIVLYSSINYSCIQIYDLDKGILKEEISLRDYDYYEKIYIQKENNYFLLITNKNILKVLDSEKKVFIFNVYLYLEYNNILQYYDFFLILRKKKLYLWNLERTYTGLKLKENILEVDKNMHVNCFCTHGKNIFIVTSKGNLYLWKDLVQKIEIKRYNVEEPFDKNIHYIHYYDNYITTKGNESIKLWLCKFSLNSISECSCVYIEFEQETKICLNINKIIVHDNFYLILDKKNCTIYTCKKNNYEDIGIFYNDHNSKIKNIFCSDKNIFSFGANGKLFDYIKKDKQIERTFCLHKFKYSITCVKYLYSEDSFLYFCVGFNNGVIKIIKMKHLYLDIIYCLKTSNNEIIKIEKSQNSQFISILADEEPYVFFLYKSSNIFMPLGYLKINEAHLKECFYFSYFNSFYILGDNNYFFKIDVKKLEEQIKQEEMSKQVGHSEGNGNGNGNEYINMMEKKKDNKNIYLNDYINDENGDVKKDALNNNEQQNNSDYDLSVKYEIIKITFNADERNKRLIKRYKNEHNELNMYNKDTNKINNKNDDGNKYGDNEATNIEQEGMEEFFEEMEGLENESDNEYKESNSSSNLSDNTYNKMNFYREKINLTQNMQDLHSDNNKDIFILKNKKKNLKRYIEILFHNKMIKNKRYENNDELPKNMLSLYLERDNRKIIYKEERNTKNNNINIDHHNNNNNGDNMNYARLKHDTINICCVTKSKKNRGFFIATQGVKNNYLFFLNLDKKDIIKYKYTDSKEDTHIDIIMPRIIYKIDNKNFLPKRTYIYKMIINEIKDLLFCLTNNNEIYIFSIKFFFLYYYIKIPVYEKVRNIFINNKNATTTSNNNNNMKKNNNMNNNFQYIFICLNNNKYIQLNFNYPFFYLLNVIKRYHINIKKFMHSFMIPNKMFLSYDSIHQYFIEEIHDYIVEEFIKKRKKKTNLMPFKYEDITDDLNFIIELLEIHNEEEKKNNQEKDDKHAQGQNEKNKNDITDIWDFIQQNKKEQEEEIEEQKKKIDLILNYDQKNISTFFNINSNNMKDVDIQYSLRDTKEYQRNEEKFRKALLYKQHIHMKINKLKKKYIKLNKRNKFLIDLDYSHYIYEMLQQNIQEIKNVFMYHEQEYDNRIKYLSNKFIRLRYIKNPIYAFNDKNHFYAKSLKMYLKNYTFKKKNRKITTKEKKIKEPKQTLELTTEIKDCLQNFNELRERNKNVKIINNEEKIEEICIKKKIIKMYEEMLLKLEKMSEERKEMDEPRKIKHISKIIRHYEENKKKLLVQINYIKETFNQYYMALKSRISIKLTHVIEEIEFLKDTLKTEMIKHTENKDNNDQGIDTDIKMVGEVHIKNIVNVNNCNENERIQYELNNINCEHDKIKKYESFLEHVNNFFSYANKKNDKIYNINWDPLFFEKKYQHYKKEDVERTIEYFIKKCDKEIYNLHIKRIQAIRLIKYISLKVISIDEKNNILIELRKKELKLRRQKRDYIKEMKNIENQINVYVDEMDTLLQEMEIQNQSRDKILEKLKELMGDNTLCYDNLIKCLKKTQDDLSGESDGSEDKCNELEATNSIVDIYNKEEIESIKKENASILSNINNIKKNMELKKNEQRKLNIKKKNIEKEIEIINDEINIIEDDKKKNISEVKFYITLKISKLRNIDYLYDKKKYRLNLASQCTVLSIEQYKDIMTKMDTITRKKEKLYMKYKYLKKENTELENINNKLQKTVNEKKNQLKNKLKKHDLNFDFNDLEKKYQEKKKKGILQEIKNKEIENNKKINILNKEFDQKMNILNQTRKENTDLLVKINEYIQILKELKNEEN
ncbi:hypothetical protein PFAG_05778 [Plasmodium falciparum Santa Lucia]|uniref:Uncharacterized protein n=2 Tax=Plasmodium falciparum TaxID=5833 RepID=A0A0L7K4X2_PLAFX|nr:hypothetical protein PFAG_05778 [Plasmodium falciparum Santa Lucia]KOB58287.1 hypothetical protein PFHG_00028 [Plasmodium falciparum HB3]